MEHFSQGYINMVRHPKERLIYVISVIINIIAVICVISLVSGEIESFCEHMEIIAAEQGTTVSKMTIEEKWGLFEDSWYDPKNQANVEIYITVAVLFLLTVAVLEYYYAYIRTSAIKVTNDQFGDICELAEKYAQIMGLKKTPEIYLVQANGIMNAFTSNVIKKRYITINIDLFEIAYRQYKDMDSIGFILGHEMAHIKLRHVSIWIRYTVMLAEVLPFIGPLLSRVREYSCDRMAQAVSKSDGIDAMMALTMGKHLYKKTNVIDYIESSKNAKGFWTWFVNLTSSHPVLPKRVRALVNPSVPGKLF